MLETVRAWGLPLLLCLLSLLGLAGAAQAQEFKEDFNGSWTGQLTNVWGDKSKVSVSNGIVTITGTHDGAGVMQLGEGPSSGLGNGLFEIRAQLRGNTVGSNSGPALVLWPADNHWTAKDVEKAGGTFPYKYSREVDIGEISKDGITYVASHWTDCDWKDCNAYETFPAPAGHNQWEWHTYAAFLQTDKITYYIDGKAIAVDSKHPSPDFANGGVNHLLGVMNRSSETELRADWVQWTSEATVLKNGGPYGGGTTPTTPPPTPPTATNYEGRYVIAARHSSKALDVKDASLDDGGVVQQWDNYTGKNQIWTLKRNADGYYAIINENSGKVLDVKDVAKTNGAIVQQWTNYDLPNQQWQVEDAGDGYVKITARHSGKVLDVSDISQSNGAIVHQWKYETGKNQQWQLQALPSAPATPTPASYAGKYTIAARHSGKVLDADGMDNGGKVQQYGAHGGTNQNWIVTAAADGYYTIANERSGKVLDVSEVSYDNGAWVHQWENFSTDNQLWKIEDVGGGYVKITAKHSGKSLDVYEASYDDGAQVVQWDFVSGDNPNQQWKMQPVGTTPTTPTPPTTPNPVTASVINVLVRGQSNAVVFTEYNNHAAVNALQSEVQRLLGFDGTTRKVNIIYDSNASDDAATTFSGTALLGDWLTAKSGDWRQGWQNNKLENQLLNFVSRLSASDKAAPAAVLWLHSEYDSKRSDLTPEEWMSAVRYDASQVRQAWGKSAADLPYLFVEAHPYWGTNEGHQAIRQGMERLVKDASFNADIATRALDLNINQDDANEYGGNHISDSDALVLAPRVARVVAEQFAQYATSGSPVAQAGGNLDDHGPQVTGATLVGTTQLRLTVKHDGAAASFKALSSDAANGVGWSVRGASSAVDATKVQVVNGTQLLVTFNGTVPTGGSLFYGYGYGRLAFGKTPGQGNAVYDNEGMPIWVSAEGLAVGATANRQSVAAQPTARSEAGPAELRVYPNPAHDHVLVSLQATADEQVQIEVRDAMSRRVAGTTHRATGGLNQVRLPLNGLPTGVYFVTVQSGGKRTVQRLTVAP